MIPSGLSALLSWLLPPLCGAVVGGVLGVFILGKLIFSRLSDSRGAIGRAAADGVADITRLALALRLSDLLPSRGSPAAVSLEGAVGGLLGGLLSSRSFIYSVRGLVSQVVTGMSRRKVSDVSRELGLQSFLADRLLPAISSERNRRTIARDAGALLAEQAGTALGDEVLQGITGVFDSYVPEAADAVVRWLRSEETRASLAERGRELLPRILERLSDLQKLFISAGQFDRRLNEKMPDIVDDTIAAVERMVRDPRQQARIVGQFDESVRGWRDSLLAASVGAPGQGKEARAKLAGSATSVLGRFLERLEDPAVRRTIASLAEKSLHEDRRTLGAFAGEVFGISETEATELVSGRVLAFLLRPETMLSIARHVCGLLFSFVEENGAATMGELLRIDMDKKRSLDKALVARAPHLVEILLPPAVEAIRRSARPARFAAAIGAGMGFAIGFVLDFLRFLGYP